MRWIESLDLDELDRTIRLMELLSSLNIKSAPASQMQSEDYKTDNFCYSCQSKMHNCYCYDSYDSYDYDYDNDDEESKEGDKNDIPVKESTE